MLKKILSLFNKNRSKETKSNLNNNEDNSKNIHRKKKGLVEKTQEEQQKKDSRKKTYDKPQKKEHEKKWLPKDFPVEKQEGRIRFYDFNLSNATLHAIADLGFKYCTPIQAGILKTTLEGRDAIGRAQTGTGKTAAFLITAISKLVKRDTKIKRYKGTPRVLILAPTRELVQQIEKDALDLAKYHPIKIVSVYGGIDYKKQMAQLKNNYIDIIIATPGRLIDFMNRKIIRLNQVKILVLDEADRMLDMGFMPDVRKIEKATPRKDKRQTLFFSATFPDSIKHIASSWTNNPAVVEIEPENVAADTVKQINYIVEADDKFKLLFNVLRQENASRILVFCNRKDTAKDLYDRLSMYKISVTLLSGDIDQRKRMNRLRNFKEGKFKVLVATDVAGRGIHIDDVSHVINYNLPDDPEDYVHRIGRTGRAGANGISISFASEDDSFNIPAIEEFLKKKLELTYPEDELLKELPEPVITLKEIREKNKSSVPKNKYKHKRKSGYNKRRDNKNYKKR
jgi:ATP-dependent RNA helicase RhlB